MEGQIPGIGFIKTLEKYKYALIVAAAGILLMLLPSPNGAEPVSVEPEVQTVTLEQRLETILSQIQGAGKVKVLLSQQIGEETHYQTDQDEDSDTNGSSSQSRTVIVSDDSRKESGLVRRTDPPRYQGAIVVCQGADDVQVRLSIVEAVCCITGLGANQISVLKMN